MSNSFLIVSVLLVIGTTSCHKKYTCKCITTDEATGNEISTRDFSYSGKIAVVQYNATKIAPQLPLRLMKPMIFPPVLIV